MSEPKPITTPPQPREPIGDSPWLWACYFSGMGLFALLMVGRRIDQRQSQIEEKEHNRQVAREFQASQAAGKTAAKSDLPPAGATGGDYWERQLSVRPLMIFFACVTVFSAAGFVWQQYRIRRSPKEEPDA